MVSEGDPCGAAPRVACDPQRIAAALAAHPGVRDASVEDVGGRLIASVALVPGARVPAEGLCTVVDESGVETPAELCDVSYDGCRLRVSGEPPRVGDTVQLSIEAPALGGVEGWLGRVCWQRAFEIGVAFEGNADEGARLPGLLAAFAAHPAEHVPEQPVGLRSRVALETAAELTFHDGERCSVATLDLSPSGAGLSARPGRDWRGRGLTVRLVELAPDDAIPGVVVRQSETVVGVAFAPKPEQTAWLSEVVATAMRRRFVSLRGLREHALQLAGTAPDEIVVEDCRS